MRCKLAPRHAKQASSRPGRRFWVTLCYSCRSLRLLQSLIGIHGCSCSCCTCMVAATVHLLRNAVFSPGLSIQTVSSSSRIAPSRVLLTAQSRLPKVAALETVSFGSCQGPGRRIQKVEVQNRKECLANSGSLDAFRRWATTGCSEQRDVLKRAATLRHSSACTAGFRCEVCEVPISELSVFSDGSLKSC